MSSYFGLIHMFVPRRFEPVIVLRGVLNGVLNFSGDAASGVFEPIDQNDRIVEMLRLRYLLIGSRLADIFAGFGAVYLYARRRAGALTDQFAGEIEVGDASSLNAVIFHIFGLLCPHCARCGIRGQTIWPAGSWLFFSIWLENMGNGFPYPPPSVGLIH